MDTEKLERAYRYCERVTYRHYENFPVASWLLPRPVRPHIAAVYAFARAADDFADEEKYRGRSLELLEQWRAALWASVPGSVPAGATSRVSIHWGLFSEGDESGASAGALPGASPLMAHPIFIALADTIRRYDLPVQWLDDLLTAFTMDVTQRRYADWAELMTYCRYSANPIGWIVLALSGVQDPQRQHLSDCICSGLQLANHWQDLRIDLARDMLYIPKTLMDQHGVSESELRKRLSTAGPAGRAPGPLPCSDSPRPLTKQDQVERSVELRAASGPVALPSPAAEERFRTLMKELVNRARALFDEGDPLVRHLTGGLRLEIKLTLAGGRAILDRIEAADYDVFRRRPSISTLDKIGLLSRALIR